MLHRIAVIAGLSLGLVGCTAPPVKPAPDLAVQCELANCVCQDPANPFSSPAPVVWQQDGTASCAAGRTLTVVKGKPPIAGIVFPDFNDAEDMDRLENPYRRH
jgi:hypothetical protein